jgi:hypothetical protein
MAASGIIVPDHGINCHLQQTDNKTRYTDTVQRKTIDPEL